ncbi:MAG TPA: PHP domain-containing protein [Clostridiaceae bacterium]|nr:PHP domain-containing protein [Clostridiaceae bacterium]
MAKILELLNQNSAKKRLSELQEIAKETDFPNRDPRYINNHIHTIYSFSPYSPTAAVYASAKAGLCTAGIIDHDSIGGASEFLAAAEILNLPVTCGFELRVSWKDSPFGKQRINNPDQDGVAYMTMQGVAAKYFSKAEEFLVPLREKRNQRNIKMIENLNQKLSREMQIDFVQDVMPLSEIKDGGSITERHLMYAFAKKISAKLGRGEPTIKFLREQGIELSAGDLAKLQDVDYEFYEYDVLGILKASFVPQIYIDADEELCTIDQFVELSKEIEAIACYAYLGDVTDSVTGDKAAQAFEDAYLDELFDFLDEKGINAVTYMPARNTPEQIARLKKLCVRHNKFQISGEDINSPRQDFICYAMENPEFSNLIDSTRALIAHEKEAEQGTGETFFAESIIKRFPKVEDRVAYFKAK